MSCTIEESYRYCAEHTRRRARNFYYAFLFLPPPRRRSIYAIYAFSRRLDDIVDGDVSAADFPDGLPAIDSCSSASSVIAEAARDIDGGDKTEALLEGLRQLEYMRVLLDRAPPSQDPLLPALQDTLARYRIPLEHFHELIAGMVMDLRRHEYRTWDDLRLYCYRVASTVGLICIEVFGHDGDAAADRGIREPAVALGIAMQLTNILRDIREDLERGRIYLPADELQRFGVTPESLRLARVDGPFQALMRFQVSRARDYFRRADSLFPRLDPASRDCPLMLRRIYSKLLDQMERRDFDVFRRRPGLSPLHKLVLTAALWMRSRLLRPRRPVTPATVAHSDPDA